MNTKEYWGLIMKIKAPCGHMCNVTFAKAHKGAVMSMNCKHCRKTFETQLGFHDSKDLDSDAFTKDTIFIDKKGRSIFNG